MLTEKVVKEHQSRLNSLLNKHFTPLSAESYYKLSQYTEQYLAEADKFFLKISKSGEKQDIIRNLHEHILFRKSILVQLNSWINQKQMSEWDTIYPGYRSDLDEFLATQPLYWYQYQNKERFISQQNDSLRVRVFKFLKRVGYGIWVAPVKMANYMLRLRKKPERDYPLWKQKIPVEKLTRWYYENEFVRSFAELKSENLKETALLANEIWKRDHQLFSLFNAYASEDYDKAALLESWKDEIRPAIIATKAQAEKAAGKCDEKMNRIFEILDQLFAGQMEIAGTLEFKRFAHRKGRRKSQLKKLKKKCIHRENRRYNTIYALVDDWKFNQEIYILKGNALKSFLMFKNRLVSRAGIVESALEKIPVVLTDTLNEIEEVDYESFRKNLQQLKYSTSKTLNGQLIPEVSDLMLEQGFPLVVDEIEQALHSELQLMTRKRILIDGFDASKEYSDGSMQSIIPLELIEFEMMAEVKKTLLQSKSKTIEQLERIKTELENLGRMVVFNLDSAIAMLDEQGEAGLKDSFIDSKAAMERAKQNYGNLKTLFDTYIFELQQTIHDSLVTFSSRLTDLTDNSRVADIRYRIARAKAIKKSEQIGLYLKTGLRNNLHKTTLYYRLSRKKIDSGIDLIKGQLGIQSISGDITSEISEYLLTGDTIVQKLPFVYRRLFVNEPLKDATFYMKRQNESGMLEKAWERWKQGVFTPALIYGEKGSGISSFVNMFVKEKIRQSPPVFSVVPAKRVNTEEDLLALLGLSFRAEAFLKLHDLYDYVEKQAPFVVYADKLHMMYLRLPGGFTILKRFFEIISNTSRKIFWICTCGLYSSQYLHKAIGLYDYFPVLIPMRKLNSEEVRNVIMMRHKTSGYDLYFKPSPEDLKERMYVKKDDSAKQEYLKTKYFNALNRHTQSNIAFALQLWLRSAEKAEDNRIHLNSLDMLDFSFVFNLPAEVIFGLHALILHERLDLFQLSQVLNISKRQAVLLLMRLADRGIVSEEKGLYGIHPLLYRQTIMLLNDRNLI
ncbi:MAG: hypothetical protein EA361_11395 [Bacteroidetes bacterium]|nr:MAG: hypothetical protein EA361_11395 [Bacteroidota bacterium]